MAEAGQKTQAQLQQGAKHPPAEPDFQRLFEAVPGLYLGQIEWQVEALPTIRGDATLLRSALLNLLGNAVKYTGGKSPARIAVGSKRRDGELVCFARDNGAGFEMKFAGQVFGVFKRLHTAQQFEGTGVGLASVRRILQRHGGRTWAEGAVDQGATFYFALPEQRCMCSPQEKATAWTRS